MDNAVTLLKARDLKGFPLWENSRSSAVALKIIQENFEDIFQAWKYPVWKVWKSMDNKIIIIKMQCSVE